MCRGAGPPIEAISSAVRHFAFELLLAASRAKSAAQPARLPSADDSCRRVAEALFFVTHATMAADTITFFDGVVEAEQEPTRETRESHDLKLPPAAKFTRNLEEVGAWGSREGSR